ncbi:AraC family transcriptional regulator [Neptunitalea chrysea]|uniref:AraC family transcriptional regulator n=1 Tax=Neptunitalea chrysea TaxID=1647581 RepID=A0A9W6B5L1_9FLAO|nr:helix-turn-helix domain-containing protein [Neptunitalea chrysea]GLB52990.1 AraC family transcriptional regulator [Neptunitalea chrysea]
MQNVNIKVYNPEELSGIAERIWLIETNENPFTPIIVASNFINIFFPLDERGISINDVVSHKPLISGVMQKPFVLQMPPNCKFLSVRLYVYGLYPLADVYNITENGPEASEALETFYDSHKETFLSNDIEAILTLVRKELISKFCAKRARKTDLLKSFYEYIVNEVSGDIVSSFCKEKDINYINLNRLCTKVIGITPKKLERLVKFRKSLDYILKTNNSFTNIAINSGYFDQPHFVKEFKFFTGFTPTAFIKFLQQEALFDSKEVINFSTF